MITTFTPPPAQAELLRIRRVNPTTQPDCIAQSPLHDPGDIAPTIKPRQDQLEVSSESLRLLQQYERNQK